MIVLGIDPGIAQMGWGIVKKVRGKKSKTGDGVKHVSHGSIKTSSSKPLSKRLLEIKRGVGELVTEHGVEEIAIERIIFNVNKASAISVAQSYGVILLLAGEKGLPVSEHNALEAKHRLTGDGRADKKSVQKELKKRFKLKKHPTPVHAADALAVALCHIEKLK
ncbi:crossover junction endodeoxyribonuclease RuvC [Candidatus Saccharibacteria bacterium]|nr:crossover junction endodeoxyribonuclease RuvC [Candidatus Saccharibacteria bacterium]